MDWHKRREEVWTTVYDDEPTAYVIVLRHVVTQGPNHSPAVHPWTGVVYRQDTSAVMMTATDDDRRVVMQACDDWLHALAIARERNTHTR